MGCVDLHHSIVTCLVVPLATHHFVCTISRWLGQALLEYIAQLEGVGRRVDLLVRLQWYEYN